MGAVMLPVAGVWGNQPFNAGGFRPAGRASQAPVTGFSYQFTQKCKDMGDSRTDYVTQTGSRRRGGAYPHRHEGAFMRALSSIMGWVLGSTFFWAAVPAQADLVTPENPADISAIVESQGWPATLVTSEDKTAFIESERNGLKFLVLFLNCDDDQKNCKTLQYYMGFSDAKGTTPDQLNEWNKSKRFARAYVDESGDPVLEMDLDLDFNGIPRENVTESFITWGALMDAYHKYIFEKGE
jgi:hypothetical protein